MNDADIFSVYSKNEKMTAAVFCSFTTEQAMDLTKLNEATRDSFPGHGTRLVPIGALCNILVQPILRATQTLLFQSWAALREASPALTLLSTFGPNRASH